MLDSNFPIYAIAFIVTFAVTVISEHLLIPKLTASAGQPIYQEGPKWHISKSGTPTMGGLAFLLSIAVTLIGAGIYLMLKGETMGGLVLFLSLGYSALNSLVGILDDVKKLKRRHNEGLKPHEKIILQTMIAIIFLILRALTVKNDTTLSFSFGEIDLGVFYYPLALLILLGITNCANLTDGIDGLASGVSFAVGVSLFYISCALSYEVCFISCAIMGATVAFLVFNLHPAKIFMGDTGSLFLGALGAAAAFALDNPLVILFVGGIYVIEGISVILQVIWFKLTGKRIFKMSPIHHHFEKCGWSENRICIVAIIMTFLLSIPAFIFYLP